MINRVILLGNTGSDPVVRNMPSGKKVCNLSLATSESWRNQVGDKVTQSEWHRLVIYNEKNVLFAENYIKKGSLVFVEGSIRSRSYTDNSGAERQTKDIIVSAIRLVSSKRTNDPDASASSDTTSVGSEYETTPSDSDDTEIDDEIPF